MKDNVRQNCYKYRSDYIVLRDQMSSRCHFRLNQADYEKLLPYKKLSKERMIVLITMIAHRLKDPTGSVQSHIIAYRSTYTCNAIFSHKVVILD